MYRPGKAFVNASLTFRIIYGKFDTIYGRYDRYVVAVPRGGQLTTAPGRACCSVSKRLTIINDGDDYIVAEIAKHSLAHHLEVIAEG